MWSSATLTLSQEHFGAIAAQTTYPQERPMNIEDIAICIRVLDELSAGFTVMPPEDSDAAKAGLACVVAQSILVEYAAHRTDGYTHDESMRLTAAKQQSVSDASASLQALINRPVN